MSIYFVLMALLCFRDICKRIVCVLHPPCRDEDDG